MPFWTLLMAKVPGDHTDAAAEFFVKRRILEECAEAIPGLLHGELVKSNDEGQLFVMCKWTEKAAYDQWVASPVRDKQNVDFADFARNAGLGTVEQHTLMFDSVHSVSGS